MCKYSCVPGLDEFSQLSQKKKHVGSVYTAFTSQKTFSQLLIIRGMSIVSLFLERVFTEGIYYVCRGYVFLVTLNMHLYDVTKHVFFLQFQYSHYNDLCVILI